MEYSKWKGNEKIVEKVGIHEGVCVMKYVRLPTTPKKNAYGLCIRRMACPFGLWNRKIKRCMEELGQSTASSQEAYFCMIENPLHF